MLVSAALLGAGRPLAARRGGLVTAGVVVAALAATWVARRAGSLQPIDRGFLPRGERAAFGRRPTRLPVRAQRLDPLSPEPLYARATVAIGLGDAAAADAFYVRATRLQPENPATWYALGLNRYIGGDLCGAYFALNEAYTLDPRSSLFYPGSELDRARDAVNDNDEPRLRPGAVGRDRSRAIVRRPASAYPPMTTTACAPWSCAARSPSSGPTIPMPRSCASRRPSPSKPGRYMTRVRVKSELGAFATPPMR